MQQGTRTAADVKHGPRGHHQRQVEAKVFALFPSAERIVQRREMRLGELPVDHHVQPTAKSARPEYTATVETAR